MAGGVLPQDGPVRLGTVWLPEGRRVSAVEEPGPVAWVTRERVPNPGRLWRELSLMAPDTGLQPVLIRDDDQGRPTADLEWVSEDGIRGFLDLFSGLIPDPEIAARMGALANADEPLLPHFQAARSADMPAVTDVDELDVFFEPGQVADIVGLDPAEVLRELWPEDMELVRLLADTYPQIEEFPGLAPAVAQALPAEAQTAALDRFEGAFLALVVADRAADIPTVTGWRSGNWWQPIEPLSALLRSWEDRFGARLVQLGPGAEIRLLVERPPRTLEAALPVAAELFASTDEWFDEATNDRSGVQDLREIASRIVNGPLWGFWWD